MKIEMGYPNGQLAVGLVCFGLAALIRFAWVFRGHLQNIPMLTGLISGFLLLCVSILFIILYVEWDPLVVPELIAITSAGVMLFWKYNPEQPGRIWLLPLCAGILWVFLTAPSYFKNVIKERRREAASAALRKKNEPVKIDTDDLIKRILSQTEGSRELAEEVRSLPGLEKRKLEGAFEKEAESGNAERAGIIGFYLAWTDSWYMTLFLNPDVQKELPPEARLPVMKIPKVSREVYQAVEQQAWKAVRMKFNDENLGKKTSLKPQKPEESEVCPYKLELTVDGLELSCVLKNISGRDRRYLVDNHFGPVSMVITDAEGKDLPFQNTAPPSDPPGPPFYSTLKAGSETRVGTEKFISRIGTLYAYSEKTKFTSFTVLEKGKDYPMPGYEYSEPFCGYLFGWHWKSYRLEPGSYKAYCVWGCSYAYRDGSVDRVPSRPPYFYEKQVKIEQPSGWQGTVKSNTVEIVLPPLEKSDDKDNVSGKE